MLQGRRSSSRTLARLLSATLAAISIALAGCGDDDDAAADPSDLTVANLNILHGIFCPPGTGDCRVEDRVDLLFDWLEAADCPDVVTLQEVLGNRILGLVDDAAAQRCAGVYQVHEPPQGSQNVTLARHPVVASNEAALSGALPRVLWHVRLDHPTGVVDVFNTHLAAGVDLGSEPCAEPCPAECVVAGAMSNRDCQAVEVAALAESWSAADSLRVLAGDFNSTPSTFVYEHLVERSGWTDTYLAAGNPECEPASGVGCTSGRESENLDELESPASNVRRRIDFAFVQFPTGGECRWQIDSFADRDRDGLSTGIFAGEPNPFAEPCGPLPDAICWPSDHEGMQVDLNCR